VQLVTAIMTKRGDRVGERPFKAITPLTRSTRSCSRARIGPGRPRQAEKVVGLCARLERRASPASRQFRSRRLNAWRGVPKNRRAKAIKPPVMREQVCVFCADCYRRWVPSDSRGRGDLLRTVQRPENVIARHIGWNNSRGEVARTAIRIFHPWPRTTTPFDTEAVLAQVPPARRSRDPPRDAAHVSSSVVGVRRWST
jgi:hypothetical protein